MRHLAPHVLRRLAHVWQTLTDARQPSAYVWHSLTGAGAPFPDPGG